MQQQALDISSYKSKIDQLQSSVKKAIKGKDSVIFDCLCALFSKGHILIEDIPGVGKTTLAYSLSISMGLDFSKVQFTSDLMPSDILGVSVFDQSKNEFVFNPGPIFTNILLADEINRATPKTQSALLEAMNESTITIDGRRFQLSDPFIVIATQNPFEHQGTFPLPESQLDRFSIRISMGYPDQESEKNIISIENHDNKWAGISPILNSREIIAIQDSVEKVYVEDSLLEYILEIAKKTRESEYFDLGVSPRGTISLKRLSQARAFLNGRDYCTPQDIKDMVIPSFIHRVVLKSKYSGADTEKSVIDDVLRSIEVPV